MPATDRLKSALGSRYSIEREIGAGGMATVYLARDLKHDREVALKVLRPDLSAVIGTDRFLSEVKIAAKLDHPHILTLIDSGEADGLLYYVLPYVRGESLRAKLDRERQLGIEEAVQITTQIASALDYAHAQGVVHRDIKPENILIHHGEAVLADFGIALAVKEAGGNRLTETGLSLGTPQYMSPEQATGDRMLDKRSDIYSLGAVFYELIAGEPPVTGATAQAMIAKLLTEKPVRLRVVRNTVTESMDTASAKALAKVPADRFSSAGDFARALAAATPEHSRSQSDNFRKYAFIATGLVAVALGAWIAFGGLRAPREIAVLRDRTQLTYSGRVTVPAISPDGKSLAYIVTNCSSRGCRYGIEMQDVGSNSSRRLLDGATAVYGLEVAPDRRNLLFSGTVNGVFGSFILSTLGGDPRLLGLGAAAFMAGGDSIAFHRGLGPGKPQWILISGTDGIPADSIHVEALEAAIGNIVVIPDSRWIIVAMAGSKDVEDRAIARDGKVGGIITFPPQTGGVVEGSRDAIWAARSREGSPLRHIVRYAFDRETGKIDSHGDTVNVSQASYTTVTDDGGSIVFEEGSSEYADWNIPFDAAIKGQFTENRMVARGTTESGFIISRDGSVLVQSKSGGAADSLGKKWIVIPVMGGPSSEIPGRHMAVSPVDSVWMIVRDKSATKVNSAYWLNRRSGQRKPSGVFQDSTFAAYTNLGDSGWVWIPPDNRSIKYRRTASSPVESITLPPWFRRTTTLTASRDGKHIGFVGWSVSLEDSIGIGFYSLDDRKASHIWSTFGEAAFVSWLDDGDLMVRIGDTPESSTFYRVTTTGKVTRLGSIPRPIQSISVSRDLRSAAVTTTDHKGDAWMSKVVLVKSR